jgi:uncharacterized lipoprotein YajG
MSHRLLLLFSLLLLAGCGTAPSSARLTPGAAGERLRPSGVTVVPLPAGGEQRAGDPRALGDPRAPIVVYEFSDFQ